MDSSCEFCGFIGGWHGCREEVKNTIARYFSETMLFDVEELTALIGDLGYYSNV